MYIAKTKMPAAVIYLNGIYALITFSYAVLFSSLTLFLTGKLNISHENTNGIVGLFLALNFALHLLAGYIGGRLLSNRMLFLISMFFQIAGVYILSLSNLKYLFYGLGLFLIGCGFNSTCLNCMLTQQCGDSDQQRETAFFINYCAMNIGFFTGFLASGYYELLSNYQTLFYICNITNVATLVILIFSWKFIVDKDTPLTHTTKKLVNRYHLMGGAIILLLIPMILLGLQSAHMANNILLTAGVGVLLLLFIHATTNKNPVEKNKIYAYLILTSMSIIFWMLFYVGPMGLTHFLKNNVDATIFHYKIPPQWIMNLNSIFVIIGSPLLAFLLVKLRRRGFNISISKQFIMSLILIAVSFYFLSLGIYYADSSGYTGNLWIVLHFLAQALGELLIAPVGYAMIGRLAPVNLQGIMMGTWMMVSGIAVTLSHHFSNMMTKSEATNPVMTNPDYFEMFNQLGLYALIAAGLLIILSPKLDKLINGEQEINMDNMAFS